MQHLSVLVRQAILSLERSQGKSFQMGKVRYTIEVSSNSDVVTNDTKVLLSAGTAQESVIVAVTPAPPKNSAPIANSDADVTDWDTPIVVDVLVNDTDKEGNALTLQSVSVDSSLAQVVVVGNKLSFTPKTGVSGQIIVSYKVRDSHGNETTGIATINVKKPQDVMISAKHSSIILQQETTENVVAPVDLIVNQYITTKDIHFELPTGVTIMPRSTKKTLQAMSIQDLAAQEPIKMLNYDIIVAPNAEVGKRAITVKVIIDEVVKKETPLFELTIEAKTPQNSDPILSAPRVSFTGDQGVVLTNKLSDADGISNLIYIVVDANGNEIPSSSANFSNLKPGNYTAYTQALAYNPDTKNSDVAKSSAVSFSIPTPPIIYAPTVQINGQDVTINLF